MNGKPFIDGRCIIISAYIQLLTTKRELFVLTVEQLSPKYNPNFHIFKINCFIKQPLSPRSYSTAQRDKHCFPSDKRKKKELISSLA